MSIQKPKVVHIMNKRSKYRAVRTSCGQHEHASKKEAKVCGDLTLMAKAGMIHDLKYQPRFVLSGVFAGVVTPVCTYVADFSYLDLDKLVVLDVKGMKTPMYRLKKKMMKACWGIEIQEA